MPNRCKPNSCVTSRHLDFYNVNLSDMSKSNRPYGLTCSQINGRSVRRFSLIPSLTFSIRIMVSKTHLINRLLIIFLLYFILIRSHTQGFRTKLGTFDNLGQKFIVTSSFFSFSLEADFRVFL